MSYFRKPEATAASQAENLAAIQNYAQQGISVGGKGGGGRPDMAQAGGPDGDKINEGLAAIEAALAG